MFDYTTTNVFGKALTSPAIIIVDRSVQSQQVIYQDLSKNTKLSVERSTLVDEWLFGCQAQASNLTHKFGEYFRVATGVATQRMKFMFFLTILMRANT